MPNWCMSAWEITGPVEDLDAIEATGLDFEKILPMPDALKVTLNESPDNAAKANLKTRTGFGDWYEFRTATWGTKWLAGHINDIGKQPGIDRPTPTQILAKMSTAWSLPTGIIKKLSADHPDVVIRITCMDDQMMFAGNYECRNGVLDGDTYEPTESDWENWMSTFTSNDWVRIELPD